MGSVIWLVAEIDGQELVAGCTVHCSEESAPNMGSVMKACFVASSQTTLAVRLRG